MRAVILAGGKGTRLAPYTTVFPKPLVPIGDMPILEIVVRQLCHFGIRHITMAVGHLAELIMAYFGDGSRFDVEISYAREDHPLGTAGPLALIPGLDEAFLVLNGDLLTTLDFGDLIGYHNRKSPLVTVAAYERQVQIAFGILTIDEANGVVDYVEKPQHTHWVSMGIYVIEPRALDFLDAGQYFDLPEFVLRLLSDKQEVCAYPFDGYWLDIGRPDDYERAIEQFAQLRAQLLHEEA
jgi:NDP-sugar pyrophosphorylase family protein